ncbi:hypothetical protein SPI_04657 [Niveomyces insectorum RCEF 264]|uniref:Extracellular membrane protein, CFEM domain protein n=1 Tax=Niveomyces insectorum RCEF 264 TaxID=1081102 RepID=A0A167UQ96_9HYPO|nr:hypothetical protein SPI_04657 [Niveomyces insectorum RCEF 264]
MRAAKDNAVFFAAALLLSLVPQGASAGAGASGAAALAGSTECLASRAPELARMAACGHTGSIEHCLAHTLPQQGRLCKVDVVEACFVNAGCTVEEARIEAEWSIQHCSAGAPEDNGIVDELRRRRPKNEDDGDSRTTFVAAAAAAAAPTTAPTNAPLTIAPRADSTTTHLVCQTTSTIPVTICPVQSTGPQSGKQTLPCYTTENTYPTCAPGLLCNTDSDNVVTCMRKENSLDAAGIVISAVFALGATISVSAMCFFCCRERRQHKRMAKAAEADAIARQAAVDKKRQNVGVAVRSVSSQSDVQPLMAQGQNAPPLPAVPSLRESESISDLTGPNPFADQHNMR